jgi:F-type H+-transporting ATPase subunit epsilon
MSSVLSLKIATPEKLVYEEKELDSVTVPTSEGEITVLPNHIPLVVKVSPGEVVTRKKGTEHILVTMQGFMHLDREGNMVILSDYAIRSEDVELAKVEAAKKKAEATMKEKVSQKDFAIAEAELRKTVLELRVASKRRSVSTRV